MNVVGIGVVTVVFDCFFGVVDGDGGCDIVGIIYICYIVVFVVVAVVVVAIAGC